MCSMIPMNILRPIHITYDAAQSPAFEHKPILAERFKTKMCRNYELTGSCPYVHRCMFAHGDEDLRTKAMNVAANLFSEEAIKQFQRARMVDEQPMTPERTPNAPSTPSSCYCESCQPTVRRSGVYRHDPYKSLAIALPAAVMSVKRATVYEEEMEDMVLLP